jgi:hypothetical protein
MPETDWAFSSPGAWYRTFIQWPRAEHMFDPEVPMQNLIDVDFVPRVLGLSPVGTGAIRIILAPSFSPGEVWDLLPDGAIHVTQAKMQFGGAILRCLGLPEAGTDPISKADLGPEKTAAFHLSQSPVGPEMLITVVEFYVDLTGTVMDGIGMIFIYFRDGVIASRLIVSPAKSYLRDCLRMILKYLKGCGCRSGTARSINPQRHYAILDPRTWFGNLIEGWPGQCRRWMLDRSPYAGKCVDARGHVVFGSYVDELLRRLAA